MIVTLIKREGNCFTITVLTKHSQSRKQLIKQSLLPVNTMRAKLSLNAN